MIEPVRRKGRYVNPLPIAYEPPPWRPSPDGSTHEPGFRDFWEWRRHRPKETLREVDVPRAAPSGPLGPPPASGLEATWAGHSSIVLRIDGLTYLIDPVWSRRLAGGLVVPRRTAPGLAWNTLPALDALLVTHDHYDHLDAPTIQKIPRSTPVFCPAGLGPWFRARGFEQVTPLSWWEEAPFHGHRVTFVPAQHFSGRLGWDRDRTLWGGFVVEGSEGHVAYHAGDSGYWDGFREIGARFPRIDLAMIPIGAYEPRWFMAPVHLDPPEAGHAFLDTGARRLLPIHWGTFRLADEPVDAPPGVLREWWTQQGLDTARLALAPLGGTVGTDGR